MTGAHLLFPAFSQVTVEDAAPAHPFLLPVDPVGSLLHYAPDSSGFRHRVHIRGAVTLFWPGRMLCLQDGPRGLCAQTDQTTPLAPGDLADLVGFPMAGDFTPTLSHATFRSVPRGQPAPAAIINADQAFQGDYDAQLVQIDGQLIGEERSANDPTIVLASGNFVFPLFCRDSPPRNRCFSGKKAAN